MGPKFSFVHIGMYYLCKDFRLGVHAKEPCYYAYIGIHWLSNESMLRPMVRIVEWSSKYINDGASSLYIVPAWTILETYAKD